MKYPTIDNVDRDAKTGELVELFKEYDGLAAKIAELKNRHTDLEDKMRRTVAALNEVERHSVHGALMVEGLSVGRFGVLF